MDNHVEGKDHEGEIDHDDDEDGDGDDDEEAAEEKEEQRQAEAAATEAVSAPSPGAAAEGAALAESTDATGGGTGDVAAKRLLGMPGNSEAAPKRQRVRSKPPRRDEECRQSGIRKGGGCGRARAVASCSYSARLGRTSRPRRLDERGFGGIPWIHAIVVRAHSEKSARMYGMPRQPLIIMHVHPYTVRHWIRRLT